MVIMPHRWRGLSTRPCARTLLASRTPAVSPLPVEEVRHA